MELRVSARPSRPKELPRPGKVAQAKRQVIGRWMPMKPAPLIARLLFPNKQPHLQRQHLTQLVAAILIGLAVAALVGTAMLYASSLHPNH